jgi:D-serine dehydratase
VFEHPCDYTGAVSLARADALATGAHFVDDERSETLFTGYAAAAGELAEQLAALDVEPTPERPLVLYLPCGVGGAPGGVTAGAKARWGEEAVIAVFVEPTASPCVLAALANGGEAVSVYDLGLSNDTVADGLAVPLASELVLERVGPAIDAAVAVSDATMLDHVGRCWREAGLRLEPSAASGFAAVRPFLDAWRGRPLDRAHHLVWTTGGSMLPDAEFEGYLSEA